ncbi:MAG: hypothetical protein AAGC70_12735 [Pseudomonadota bacterium]
MGSKWEADITTQIAPPWTHMSPKRIGDVPEALSTPYAFLRVRRNGTPFYRLDLYYPRDTYCFTTKAIAWNNWLVVGYGDRVTLISNADASTPTTPPEQTLDLASYFMDFWPTTDDLLIMSGHGISCVAPNGQSRWHNNDLGLDGVIIRSVEHGVICGDGEWDPPGDWQPFAIYTATGQSI